MNFNWLAHQYSEFVSNNFQKAKPRAYFKYLQRTSNNFKYQWQTSYYIGDFLLKNLTKQKHKCSLLILIVQDQIYKTLYSKKGNNKKVQTHTHKVSTRLESRNQSLYIHLIFKTLEKEIKQFLKTEPN